MDADVIMAVQLGCDRRSLGFSDAEKSRNARLWLEAYCKGLSEPVQTSSSSRSRLGPPVLTSTPAVQNMAKSAPPARRRAEGSPSASKKVQLKKSRKNGKGL